MIAMVGLVVEELPAVKSITGRKKKIRARVAITRGLTRSFYWGGWTGLRKANLSRMKSKGFLESAYWSKCSQSSTVNYNQFQAFPTIIKNIHNDSIYLSCAC